jgi:hypothetical protein
MRLHAKPGEVVTRAYLPATITGHAIATPCSNVRIEWNPIKRGDAMKRILALSLAALSLSGCVTAEQQALITQRDQALAECRAKYPTRTQANIVDAVRCDVTARRVADPLFPRIADLAEKERTALIVLAERAHKGEISMDEYAAQAASLKSEAIGQAQSRELAQRSVAAQEAAAIAAATPVYQPPAMQHCTAINTGSITNMNCY